MTQNTAPPQDRSLGELVASASKDVSQLVKAEIALATSELKKDATRVGIAIMAGVIICFIALIVLILCSIAVAYALVGLGIWHWAALLIVAGGYVLLGALLGFIGYRFIKRLTGIKLTKETVKADLALLKRSGDEPDAVA